jgi:hypothetical protein
MRSCVLFTGDSALLLGGELSVTVHQAEELLGSERTTHPFARVRVGDQSQLTSVQWQNRHPSWDETLIFRDTCAASELVIELWDVGGSKNSAQLQRLVTDPARVIANSRFLGRVEVALSGTLSMRRGELQALHALLSVYLLTCQLPSQTTFNGFWAYCNINARSAGAVHLLF